MKVKIFENYFGSILSNYIPPIRRSSTSSKVIVFDSAKSNEGTSFKAKRSVQPEVTSSIWDSGTTASDLLASHRSPEQSGEKRERESCL